MLVNVVEAKSKFSNLLSFVSMGGDEVVIAKRDKPMAVLVSYETFLHMKKQIDAKIDLDRVDNATSSLDKYVGIVAEEELDYGYKESREAYLKDKYL
jgi:prevent-host-death family protein